MFEPLLSLNPQFARTMVTAAAATALALLPAAALALVGATTAVLVTQPLAYRQPSRRRGVARRYLW
jgi:hypothetical protein